MNKTRPIHLALHLIKLPPSGIVSILHRISGLLLFLCLPLLLWMLQYSLRSIETYTQLMALLQHPLSKLALITMLWAFSHHFFAGLRYLAIDLHFFGGLTQSRNSSKLVLVLSVISTLWMGVKLW